MDFKHKPILLNECIEGLNIKPDGTYVDCTLGGAGHSSEILKRLNSMGMLIGIDQDKDAIKASEEKLKDFTNKKIVNDNFAEIKSIFKELKLNGADGFLLDLGVSSYQLDKAERGFSYMHDAPLDMRMNTKQDFNAYDVVNSYSKYELQRVIRDYGEEKWASRIADFIVEERKIRPIETTFQLVDIIKKAIPASARRDGPHPAKRTFQAIRIEVNQEISILEDAVNDIIDLLNPGGRICVITFHSLEDRIIKNIFKRRENPCTCPPEFPICVCGKTPEIQIITKKPIVPKEKEIQENPRARSAKLRIAEKL